MAAYTQSLRSSRRKLPTLDVPRVEDQELKRYLDSVAEHLRMYEGSGGSLQRFVTIDEIKEIGLAEITTKNQYSFLSGIASAADVSAGTATASTAASGSSGGSSGTTTPTGNTFAGLDDTYFSGLSDKNFARYDNASGLWVDYNLYAASEVITGQWSFEDRVDIDSGSSLRINDLTDTDYVDFSHDGTDFNFTAVNTEDIVFSGYAGDIRFVMLNTGDAVKIENGGWFQMYDAADVNSMIAGHDGVDMDFVFGHATTVDVTFTGMTRDFNIGDSVAPTASTTGPWSGQADHAVRLQGTTNEDNVEFALSVIEGANNRRARFFLSDETGEFGLHAAAGSGVPNFGLYIGATRIMRADTTSVDIRNAVPMRFYDAANTDYAAFSHDGVDFNTVFVNTTNWNIDDMTNIRIRGASTVVIQDGAALRIFDATDTDRADFSHNGTDFITAFTTTADWQLQGLSQFELRSGCDLRIYGPDNSNSGFIAHTNSNFQIVSAGSSNIQMVAGSGLINLVTGQTLRIFDLGNTDRLEMSHDGVDFNMVGANSTDLNITGFTAVQSDGTLRVLEGAAAAADSAGYGQFWVLNTAPNRPKFTDDAGNDWDIPISNTKYKTANESVTSSTTFQNDDHLASFSLLADTWYKVEGYFIVTSTSAGDFKTQWTFTNAPQSSAWTVMGSDAGSIRSSDHAGMTTSMFLAIDGTDAHGYHVMGYVRTNAATGGTATLQWAQNSSNATAAVLYAGSWVTFTKLS